MLYRLNKSYEALEYGFEADAFTDLTGGLAEWYNPADLREEDFYLIRAAFQCGAVIGCLSVVSWTNIHYLSWNYSICFHWFYLCAQQSCIDRTITFKDQVKRQW